MSANSHIEHDRRTLAHLLAGLDLERVVNGGGAVSRFGGTTPSETVLAAMADAQRAFVDIDRLNRVVGEYVANRLGVEDAMITAGASHGIVLATAASITGGRGAYLRSRSLIQSLDRRSIAIQAHHVGNYASAYEAGGGELVTIGTAELCEVDDLVAALESGRVAGVAHLVHPGLARYGLSLCEASEIAHQFDLPVLVDGAASVPPARNLIAHLEAGADIVSISGGKGLGGPQASGLLLGSRALIDVARQCAAPNYGLGRTAKITREAILGLRVAVDEYLDRDEGAWLAAQRHVLEEIRGTVADVASEIGFNTDILQDDDEFIVPALIIRPRGTGNATLLPAVQQCLLGGAPPIFVRFRRQFGYLMVIALNLHNDEAELLALRLCDALQECRPQ